MDRMKFKGSHPTDIEEGGPYLRNPIQEFMFYQDMLVQVPGMLFPALPDRLAVFGSWIHRCRNYAQGRWDHNPNYTYLSVKRMPVGGGNSFSRPGWHIDGFLSTDRTFIYSDCWPTCFSTADFDLTPDHTLSLGEMEEQAESDWWHMRAGALLNIDEHCVHRVNVPPEPHTRTFVKIVLSDRPFNLEGNALNPKLKAPWDFHPRTVTVNTDSTVKSNVAPPRNDPGGVK